MQKISSVSVCSIVSRRSPRHARLNRNSSSGSARCNRISHSDDHNTCRDRTDPSYFHRHHRTTEPSFTFFTMLPARFTRTFIFVVLALLLIASLLVLHEPTRKTYVDPYTGILFDDGGVQEDYLADKVVAVNPTSKPLEAVHGDVIMGKLGNETAK